MNLEEARFVDSLVRCGVENPAETALDLMKLSRSYQGLQVAACNGELTPRQETRERNLEAKIRALVESMGHGIKVKLGGDPRGYTAKLHLPTGEHNSWDGESMGVPTS